VEIFSAFPGDIWMVSWRYLMGFLEIFDVCPGDLMGVVGIFDGCPGDICRVCWSYLMGLLQTFDGFHADI